MANFKAVVRGERKDGFMQVYIRVTHRRVHGYIKTDKMITKRELSKTKEIKDPFVLNWCSERILEFNERLNESIYISFYFLLFLFYQKKGFGRNVRCIPGGSE